MRMSNTFLSVRHLLQCLMIAVMGLMLSGCFNETGLTKPWEPAKDISSCFPCIIYDSAFAALDNAIISLTTLFSQHAMVFLGFGLLFWLAFKVGGFAVSLQQPNIKQFVLGIISVLFKAMIVSALIYNPEAYVRFIGENIIQPILLVFTELSRLILGGNEVIKTSIAPIADIEGEKLLSATGQVIFGETKSYILDIIYRVTVALGSGIGLGLTLLADFGFVNMIISIIIILIFFHLLLWFPLMFIDSFVRLGILIVLSPFVWVAWVFPATKGFLKKAWEMAFGSMFNILFGCLYISIVIYVVAVYMDRSDPWILNSTRQTMDPSMVKGFQNMRTDNIAFIVLLLALNKMAGLIPKLAAQFGGDGTESSLLKSFNGAKKLAKEMGKAAALAALTVASGGSALAASGKALKDSAKASLDAVKDTAKDGAGANGNG